MLREDVNVTVFSNILVIVGVGETATLLKRPRTPPSTTPTVDYQSADSEHLMKRARPGVQPVDEVKTVSIIYHTGRFSSRLSVENVHTMNCGNILQLKFWLSMLSVTDGIVSRVGIYASLHCWRRVISSSYCLLPALVCFCIRFTTICSSHIWRLVFLDRSIMLDQAIHRILFQLTTCPRLWPAISIRAHVLWAWISILCSKVSSLVCIFHEASPTLI